MVAGGGIGTVIVVVLALLFGRNPSQVLQQVGQGQSRQQQPGAPVQASPRGRAAGRFVKTVLADTEDVWRPSFRGRSGAQYREPKLVLFRDRVQSALRHGQRRRRARSTAPATRRSTSTSRFFDELQRRFKAPGDFAQAT